MILFIKKSIEVLIKPPDSQTIEFSWEFRIPLNYFQLESYAIDENNNNLFEKGQAKQGYSQTIASQTVLYNFKRQIFLFFYKEY